MKAVKGKMSPAELVKARQVEDRIRRAAPPKVDPTGAHREALLEIAEAAGRPYHDVLDEWEERAAVRQYMAGTSRDEAERLAVEDVRERPRGAA